MISGPTIAVTGATGQQGGAVAQALAASGAQLRQVDLTERAAVTGALQGTDAVFVMATMLSAEGIDGEIRTGTAVADAVADSDASYAVYSSVGGAERHTGVPHFDSKRRIEQHFESLGLHTGFVRPVLFMDNFAAFAKPTIEDGTIVVRHQLPAERPLQLIAVTDIGTVAAAMLLDPDSAPAAIEIGGDELTGTQIADAFAQRYGLPASYEALPASSVGDPDQEKMFAWIAEPPAYEADFTATRALAPDVHTFAQWLADFGPDDLG